MFLDFDLHFPDRMVTTADRPDDDQYQDQCNDQDDSDNEPVRKSVTSQVHLILRFLGCLIEEADLSHEVYDIAGQEEE